MLQRKSILILFYMISVALLHFLINPIIHLYTSPPQHQFCSDLLLFQLNYLPLLNSAILFHSTTTLGQISTFLNSSKHSP